MNTNAASLDRLHDIIVPAPVPWWPPAPGWYWVIAVVAIVLVAALIKGILRWQHNRYRREALAELGRLECQLKHADARPATLLALSELLKRTALSAFSREEVASLSGTKWYAFLDRAGNTKVFGNGLGAILGDAINDPRTSAALNEQSIQELTQAIRHWIKHHDTDFQQKEAKVEKPNSSVLSSSPSVSKT